MEVQRDRNTCASPQDTDTATIRTPTEQPPPRPSSSPSPSRKPAVRIRTARRADGSRLAPTAPARPDLQAQRYRGARLPKELRMPELLRGNCWPPPALRQRGQTKQYCKQPRQQNNWGQVCIVFHTTCFCREAAANTNACHQLVRHRVTAFTVNWAALLLLPSLQTQPCFRCVEAFLTEQVAAGVSSAHTTFFNLYPHHHLKHLSRVFEWGRGTEFVDRSETLPQAMTARAHFLPVPVVPSTISSVEQRGSKSHLSAPLSLQRPSAPLPTPAG